MIYSAMLHQHNIYNRVLFATRHQFSRETNVPYWLNHGSGGGLAGASIKATDSSESQGILSMVYRVGQDRLVEGPRL